MSHWAEIDETGLVLRVLVGDNNEPDEGHQWLLDNLGGTWVQTSYNGTIRKNFAGIGFTYMGAIDAFVAPKCHDEATLNLETCRWECPNSDHEIQAI
jgi:hypothetical protein